MAATYFQTLNQVLNEERPSTAFYYGRLHSNILELLVSRLEPGGVQAMSQGGRLSHDAQIPWLRRGVMFWDEGGHNSELIIKDSHPWSPSNFKKIIEWGGRYPPRIFFFADEAVTKARHDTYDWKSLDGCLIARQKSPLPKVWKAAAARNPERFAWAQQGADYLATNPVVYD